MTRKGWLTHRPPRRNNQENEQNFTKNLNIHSNKMKRLSNHIHFQKKCGMNVGEDKTSKELRVIQPTTVLYAYPHPSSIQQQDQHLKSKLQKKSSSQRQKLGESYREDGDIDVMKQMPVPDTTGTKVTTSFRGLPQKKKSQKNQLMTSSLLLPFPPSMNSNKSLNRSRKEPLARPSAETHKSNYIKPYEKQSLMLLLNMLAQSEIHHEDIHEKLDSVDKVNQEQFHGIRGTMDNEFEDIQSKLQAIQQTQTENTANQTKLISEKHEEILESSKQVMEEVKELRRELHQLHSSSLKKVKSMENGIQTENNHSQLTSPTKTNKQKSLIDKQEVMVKNSKSCSTEDLVISKETGTETINQLIPEALEIPLKIHNILNPSYHHHHLSNMVTNSQSRMNSSNSISDSKRSGLNESGKYIADTLLNTAKKHSIQFQNQPVGRSLLPTSSYHAHRHANTAPNVSLGYQQSEKLDDFTRGNNLYAVPSGHIQSHQNNQVPKMFEHHQQERNPIQPLFKNIEHLKHVEQKLDQPIRNNKTAPKNFATQTSPAKWNSKKPQTKYTDHVNRINVSSSIQDPKIQPPLQPQSFLFLNEDSMIQSLSSLILSNSEIQLKNDPYPFHTQTFKSNHPPSYAARPERNSKQGTYPQFSSNPLGPRKIKKMNSNVNKKLVNSIELDHVIEILNCK